VDMHATEVVGINGITRVLLVYTCQQAEYPPGHILPLRFPGGNFTMKNFIICNLHRILLVLSNQEVSDGRDM
jgi:hypothetical protein